LQRRTFFRRLLGTLGAAVTGSPVRAERDRVIIQESRIAGFQFHSGEAVWSSLSAGDRLKLVREPKSVHDPNAVAVYFHDQQLGYIPRAENSTIAQMLDRGEQLDARICRLVESSDPWERVRITVSLA
jgi:hypothetical protein